MKLPWERNDTNRRTFLRAAGVGAVTTLAGCLSGDSTSTTGTPPEERRTGGTLTVANESKLTGLDPHSTASVVSWNVIYNVCETLTTFEGGAVTGRLADDWSVSDDGTEYTVTLKEGVQFHPPVGRELTAEDVVYSFERMQRPEAQMSGDLEVLADVRATDTYTVEFTLERTFAPWINFLARVAWVIVPREAVEDQGEEIGDFQEPVGTGPFVLDEHVQGDHTTLSAFDDYREEGVPYLDTVRFMPVPDGDSRTLAVRNGDADFARGVPPKDAGSLADREDVDTIVTEATAWGQVYINNDRSPWDDPAVRRAVAHLLDREVVIEAGLHGYGDASWQPYSSNSYWHTDLENARERDAERAEQILEDAGNPLAGETLEIKTTGAYPIMESTATVLAQNLEEAGIDAEINKMEWGTMLNDFLEGNFGAMAFSVPQKVDPDRYYYPFIHPDGPQYLDYGENQPDAERMYDLLERGRSETDQSERKRIYGELQGLVNEHVPWLSVGTNSDIAGVRSNVVGDPTWLLPYNRLWTLSIGQT